MTRHFLNRGYPQELLEQALIKARRQDRNTLLTPKVRSSARPNPPNLGAQDCEKTHNLTTMHHPFTDNWAKRTVQQQLPILASSAKTLPLAKCNFVYGHRRNPNLRNILVRSTLDYHPEEPPPTRKTIICTTPNCRFCPVIDKSGIIRCTTTNRTYSSMVNANCKRNNLIYCITCLTCHKQYIGQTKRMLIERFRKHFWNITSKRNEDPIGLHFNLPQHNGLNDVRIHIIQYIKHPSESILAGQVRDQMELKWMHRFHTVTPRGLNVLD